MALHLREQVVDVAGQEIMTADKVSLRLNAVQFLVLETKTTAGGTGNPFEGQALTDALTDVDVTVDSNGGDF